MTADQPLLVFAASALGWKNRTDAMLRLFAAVCARRADARLLLLLPDHRETGATLAAFPEIAESCILRSAAPGEVAQWIGAADLDPGVDPLVSGLLDPKPDLAVVDQQLVALGHRREQFRMRQADPRRGPGRFLAVERERLACREHRRAALEVADPELRPLQIDQDRGRPPLLLLERANRLEQRDLRRLVAMAHVDPERVRAGLVELTDHLRAAARRPECGEDAHLARAGLEWGGHGAGA